MAEAPSPIALPTFDAAAWIAEFELMGGSFCYVDDGELSWRVPADRTRLPLGMALIDQLRGDDTRINAVIELVEARA